MPRLIGVLFGYAGIYKLLYPGQATLALLAVDVPHELANAIVPVMSVFELSLGVLLTLEIKRKCALALSMAVVLGFTLYLWHLSTLANPPSCGCLGLGGIFKSNRQEALFGVFRNCVILWALKSSWNRSGNSGETHSICSGRWVGRRFTFRWKRTSRR